MQSEFIRIEFHVQTRAELYFGLGNEMLSAPRALVVLIAFTAFTIIALFPRLLSGTQSRVHAFDVVVQPSGRHVVAPTADTTLRVSQSKHTKQHDTDGAGLGLPHSPGSPRLMVTAHRPPPPPPVPSPPKIIVDNVVPSTPFDDVNATRVFELPPVTPPAMDLSRVHAELIGKPFDYSIFKNVPRQRADTHPAPAAADTTPHYRLAIATAIFYEDEYLLEWLVYHMQLGVEHFYIHDLRPFSERAARVLAPFIMAGRVTLTIRSEQWKWTLPRLLDQVSAIGRILKAHASHVDWLFVMDVDEFYVLPPGFKSLLEVVAHHESYGYASIHIPWKMVGAGGLETAPHEPVPSVYTMVAGNAVYDVSEARIYRRHNGKVIFKGSCMLPRSIYHPHDCPLIDDPVRCRPGPMTNETVNRGYLMHYNLKAFDTYLVKRGRTGFSGLRDDVIAMLKGMMTHGGHWNSFGRPWHDEWVLMDSEFSKEKDTTLVAAGEALKEHMKRIISPDYADYVRSLPPRVFYHLTAMVGRAQTDFVPQREWSADLTDSDTVGTPQDRIHAVARWGYGVPLLGRDAFYGDDWFLKGTVTRAAVENDDRVVDKSLVGMRLVPFLEPPPKKK